MKYGVCLLVVLTGLFFWPLTFEQFETPKNWALISFACVALFYIDIKQIFFDKIAFGLFLFALSVAISCIGSIDPHMSLWGNTKCPNGWLTNLSYFVVYLAAAKLSPIAKIEVKKTILFCGMLVAGYSICQTMGIDFMTWKGTVKEGQFVRPPSTMGHPNFTAAYLSMVLPFAVSKYRSNKWDSIIASFFIGVAIILSQSRGMWLAAASGMLVYGLMSGASYRAFMKGFGLTLAMAALIVIVVPSFNVGAGYRLKSIFAPGEARLAYPAAAIRIWKKHPFFGVGTDAFETAFQHERTARYWEIEQAGSPTRAHCEPLNILATQGLFGILSVLFLTCAIILRLKERPDAVLGASITAFYIQNLSSFTVISVGVLFMICLSFLTE